MTPVGTPINHSIAALPIFLSPLICQTESVGDHNLRVIWRISPTKVPQARCSIWYNRVSSRIKYRHLFHLIQRYLSSQRMVKVLTQIYKHWLDLAPIQAFKPYTRSPIRLCLSLLTTILSGGYIMSQAIEPAHSTPIGKTDKDTRKLINGWQLDQVNRSFGALKIYISDKHLKIIQLRGDREIISSAPDWTFYSIDHRAHSYSKSTSTGSNDLLMQRVLILMGGDLSKVKWQPVRNSTICGIKAEHMIDSTLTLQQSLSAPIPDELSDELRIKGFWVAKDLQLNPRVTNQLAHWHGLPETGKLPLAFVHHSTAGHTGTVLQTIAIKPMLLKPTLFDLPKDFKETKTDIDIDTRRRKTERNMVE